MGLALIQGNPIGLTFPIIFYARILGTEVTLEDVKEDEPALYNSMTHILSRSTDAELADYRIKIDGVSSDFTVENRDDLIRRKVNSLIDPAVDPSLNLIIATFREMIPVTVTEGFTARALRDIIVGSSTFEVEDLMANAQLIGYHRQSRQITWLGSFLRELGPEDRRRFLRFCTGSTHLPIGGFAALASRIVIERYGSPDSLTTSETCYNKLKLPPYESYKQLRRMVGMALNARSGIGKA
jgi:E3 ubiquitin-protein ligase NEDD4